MVSQIGNKGEPCQTVPIDFNQQKTILDVNYLKIAERMKEADGTTKKRNKQTGTQTKDTDR